MQGAGEAPTSNGDRVVPTVFGSRGSPVPSFSIGTMHAEFNIMKHVGRDSMPNADIGVTDAFSFYGIDRHRC